MSADQRALLAALNGGVNSAGNPNGLNGAGTGRLFVQALNAMAGVGNEVAALAADVTQRAASAGVAADHVAGLMVEIDAANDLFIGLRDATIAAAASVQPGQPNGVAELDDAGHVPAEQMGPPQAHAHAVTDTTGLQAALDAKAAAGHTHAVGDTSGLQTALDAKAALAAAQMFAAAQRGTVSALADGAAITPNFALANYFAITLGGNRTLANPSNLTAGQGGSIFVTQDGSGGRTLSFGSYWDFAGGTAPTLSTAANTVDRIDYVVRSSTSIHAALGKAFS